MGVEADRPPEEQSQEVRRSFGLRMVVAVLGLGIAGVGMAPAANALDITWGKTKAPH